MTVGDAAGRDPEKHVTDSVGSAVKSAEEYRWRLKEFLSYSPFVN